MLKKTAQRWIVVSVLPLTGMAGEVVVPGEWTSLRREADAALAQTPDYNPRIHSGQASVLANTAVLTADGAEVSELTGQTGIRVSPGHISLRYFREPFGFTAMRIKPTAEELYGSTFWTGNEGWARIGKDCMHPGNACDVARVFIAPTAGRIAVSGTVKKLHLDGDGIRATIQHGTTEVWKTELDGKDATGKEVALELDVEKGDAVRFILNRRDRYECDTTGWDPVVTYADGTRYQASEGFSDNQDVGVWQYTYSAQPPGRRPDFYAVGKDFRLYKNALDTSATFPFLIVSDGNKEDGFGGYVIAFDNTAPWRLEAGQDGIEMSGDGSARVIRYNGTWIEGLKLLARADTFAPQLGAACRAEYERIVAGVKHAPELDLFLLVVSEWVQDDNLFGGGDAARLATCTADQSKRAAQLTGSAFEPKGTGWDAYLNARLTKRSALLSDPRLSFGELLFSTRRNPSWNHEVAQYFGWRQRPGGSLYVLERPGISTARRDLINGQLPNGSFLEPRLSYDAQKIIFSFVATDNSLSPSLHVLLAPADFSRRNEQDENNHYYHLYEIGADGTGLRQITRDPYDDLMPEWLPDGGIAFVSTRRRASSRCFWHGYADRWHSYTLFRMNPDGSDLTQLSWNDVNEWFPAVANNGHLLFARWDYIDRDAVTHQNLWSMRPDGTNPLAVWGNESPNPHCTFQGKPIPDSTKVACVASAHHAITGGPIMLIDPSIHNNSLDAVTRFTPGHFPESESWTIPEWYNSPWPFAEDLFLVSYSRDPLMFEPVRHNPDYALGLYVLDADGNRELLYRDSVIGVTCPIPLAPRPVPPVLSSVRDPMLAAQGLGEMFISDIYEGLPNATRGSIKQVRVVQVFPKTTRDADVPRIGVAGEENTRAVLGVTPVEEDGSARFLVPAGKPIFLQALDADGFAYRTMRSSTSLMPGESVSCTGCHENKMTAGTATLVVTAMKRPAAELTPTPESGRPYGFVENVQPVFDANCASCHNDTEAKGGINLSRKTVGRDGYTSSYDSLCFAKDKDGRQIRRLSKMTGNLLVTCFPMRNQIQVTPEGGADGAIGSGLIQMLKAGHNDVELSHDDLLRIATWIDLNAVFYGVYEPEDHLVMQRQGKPVPMPVIQ